MLKSVILLRCKTYFLRGEASPKVCAFDGKILVSSNNHVATSDQVPMIVLMTSTESLRALRLEQDRVSLHASQESNSSRRHV